MVTTENATDRKPGTWQSLLILGRTSNLPTVWSNCLAAWLIAGGGPLNPFVLLCVGATFLYLGGMFLNDAFDEPFDRAYRRERPIPAGAISSQAVWGIGGGLLLLGIAALFYLGRTTGILGLVLMACIVLYDAVHKSISFAPVIIAACRFLLYLVAGSVAAVPLTENGIVVWAGVVLAAYVVGLSYLARRESMPGPMQYGPLVLLATPFLLVWIINGTSVFVPTLLLSVLLLAWIVRCLRFTLGRETPRIGQTVAGLLAGITLVDALIVVGANAGLTPVFPGLFLIALLFQRYVPAT